MKFLVLSNARSGTSLLTETLNSHPDIVCHGEIFHPDPTWHLKGTFANLSVEEKLEKRSNIEDFVDSVFDQPGAVAVGAKMWLDQNPEWCANFLADESIYKIIYERGNKLAQFSSGELAKRTQIWNLNPGQKLAAGSDIKLSFDEKAFSRFIEHQSKSFDYYRSNAKGPVLEVKFDTIASGDFEGVLKFLQVKKVPLQPQKSKIYSSDILDRYKEDDHELILKMLHDLKHEEWAFE